jgi:hypothetical protein
MIVHTVDESTTESRMAILANVILGIHDATGDNRFGYEYLVNEHSDLTPLNPTLLEPVNAYIPDTSIVNLITTIYEIDDDTWYANNRDIANDFFADRPYPMMYAVEMLGYPERGNDDNNELAPGFNPSEDP